MTVLKFLTALSIGLAVGLATPAAGEAAVHPVADFQPGNTFGVGLLGLSYDYAFSGFSLGLGVRGLNDTSPLNTNGMIPGIRAVGRFLDRDQLSAGVVGGMEVLPGSPSDRSYLIGDLGVALAYRFHIPGMGQFGGTATNANPLVLRLNVTLSASERPGGSLWAPVTPDGSGETIRPNFFQRLGPGPLTMVSLAYMPSEHVEFTLGGGTLIGARLKY